MPHPVLLAFPASVLTAGVPSTDSSAETFSVALESAAGVRLCPDANISFKDSTPPFPTFPASEVSIATMPPLLDEKEATAWSTSLLVTVAGMVWGVTAAADLAMLLTSMRGARASERRLEMSGRKASMLRRGLTGERTEAVA